MRTICFITLISLVTCNAPRNEESTILPLEENEPDRELFYHYSIWPALVNEIFDGSLSVRELESMGDMGLGTYNGLDGELVMLDGVVYQVLEDGTVGRASEGALIPFVNATWFDPDITFEMEDNANYEMLRTEIEFHLPSPNYFYAFRIAGTFDFIKCGTIRKQEKPYRKSLEELVAERPQFERRNINGTLVGFLCPEFIDNINIAGFHLHFISDDRQFGGHVMSFEAASLNVEIDKTSKYQFVLPETNDFSEADFEKAFEYGN